MESMKIVFLSSLFVALGLLGSAGLLHGQGALDRMDLFQFMATTGQGFSHSDAFNRGDIAGSPFLHDDWVRGQFSLRGEETFEGVEMRYEAISGILSIMHRQDSVFLRPQMVPEFSYTHAGEEFVFKNGYFSEQPRVNRDTYLRVLYENEGEWSVYEQVRKEFKAAEAPNQFTHYQRYDAFEDNSRLLVRSPEGEWAIFRPGRRAISRLFDDGRKATGYFRSNDLSYTNASDIGRLFKHMGESN